MKRKFFVEPPLSPLGGKILYCLGLINSLKRNHRDLRMTLLNYKEDLSGYLNDPDYTNLPESIKKQSRVALNQINDKLKRCGSLQEDNHLALECLIQIPSPLQLTQMKGMCAGGQESQAQRLKHMVAVIDNVRQKHPSLPLVTTNDIQLATYWQDLFSAIDQGNATDAMRILRTIAGTDWLVQAITSVHSVNYLTKLIQNCILAQKTGTKRVGTDLTVTPKTFEVLIKDLVTTLSHRTPLYFSFGLPSHHAFNEEGSGFCILNKTAILVNYIASAEDSSAMHLIVGSDVNRDNGLCEILRTTSKQREVYHFDIFDPRVYPAQDFATINEEFGTQGVPIIPGVNQWSVGTYHYFALALNLCPRHQYIIHPTLIFSLEQIKRYLIQAQAQDRKMAIYLPTGWDSHRAETAACGKLINERFMSKEEADHTRFNDDDLLYFYKSLFELYSEHRSSILGIYWGLEGGYNRAMYQNQTQLLLEEINTQLQLSILAPLQNVRL